MLSMFWNTVSVSFQTLANCLADRYYCLSTLDKHHHSDMTYEQGLKLLDMCVDELKRRLPIDFKGVSFEINYTTA